MLEREKGSTWIVQNRGGVEDAIEKIAMLRKALTEDYDELGFGSHGNPGIVEITHTFEDGRPDEIETSRTPLMVLPGQVAVQNSDDLKMIPQAGNLNKLIEAGKKGGFKGFVVGMCYRYADEIVKLGIVPPKVVFSHPDGNKNSICGIKVYPSKIQKTVDDVEVTDDNKRYEQ